MTGDVGSDRRRLGATTKIDVRTIPVWQRHPLIFAAFDALVPGDGIALVTDHEPRPLRAEFEATRRGSFVWHQRRAPDGHWEAEIRRLATEIVVRPHDVLYHVAAFAAAGPAEIEALASRARFAAVRRGRAVVEQGVTWPYVGVVASGSVQAMLIAPDGRELALYEIRTGELFGTVALADEGVSPLRFVAREGATSLMLLPISTVKVLMQRYSEVADAVDALNAQHFRAVVQRFGAQIAQPVAARVADALLAYASPQRGLVAALEPLPRMRQVELAVIAGTAKDMVYRSIAEFEEAGALERENGRIVRLDRAKLARFSETLKY